MSFLCPFTVFFILGADNRHFVTAAFTMFKLRLTPLGMMETYFVHDTLDHLQTMEISCLKKFVLNDAPNKLLKKLDILENFEKILDPA